MNRERRNNLILRTAVTAVILLLIPLCAWLSLRRSGGGTLRLNELLSANSAYPDSAGRFRDFVELRNTGDTDCDLSGWGLSDDARTVKYRFPEGTVLPAGGYLVVWCDSAAEAGENAAPFSLAKEGGETVTLSNRYGAVVDSMTTLPAERNRSMIPDGAGGWSLCEQPTPGFENSEAGRAAYLSSRSGGTAQVLVNEYMSANSLHAAPDGQYCDWIELRNAGGTDADLSLWSLSDTAERTKYIFPEGTVLPAGGYLVVWCGPERTGFSLRRAGGETVCLTDAAGGILDRVETAALAKNRSMARGSDGSWSVSAAPTPGYENSEAGWLAYLTALGCADAEVAVSEAMADNRSCLPDASGAFPDWVELCNPGGTAVDLDGWWLSDDPEDPVKWRISGLTLEPGGYAVIFCDGQDRCGDGEYHAGFSLSAAGEAVSLATPVGSVVSTLRFEHLGTDESAAAFGAADAPSPGYPNSAEGVLAFRTARETPAPLAIYELMSANDFFLRQSDGGYYDWVELKNISGEPLDLSGWSLSDDPALPRQFVFPSRILDPGDCVTVLLCGADHGNVQGLYAEFGLDAAEDRLFLYTPEGALQDYVGVSGLPYRHSLGRMDGQRGFFLFDAPTPGADNAGGARGLSATPEADAAPGVYDNVERVTVTLRGEGEIRYTTDGSVPTADSALYDSPIVLTGTTVLRARCFAPGLLPGRTATLNYVINEGHSLPVVCLSMAPEDFDGPNGIYTDLRGHSEVWANLSLFEPDGGGFSLDCGAKLHGAGSRTHYEKKSMKVNFRPRYGGDLNYDVFGDGAITGFDSLLLRGGNVMYGNVLLKDAMIALAANAASDHVLALNARFAVLYVNGRYWGVYCIREAYSERYVADHLGGSEEDVTILQGPISDEPSGLHRLLLQISLAGDGEEGAAWLESWLDVDNAVDWMIFEAFFTNMDIPGNVRYIRGGEDGLWRYGLYDLDESLYEEAPNWAHLLDPAEQHGTVPRAILNNPVLRERVLCRLAELLQGGLSADRLSALLEELVEQLDPEMDRELARWGGGIYWKGSTTRYLEWFRADRGEKVARALANYLHLSDEEFYTYFPFYR